MSGEAVERSRATSHLLQKYPHVLQDRRVADLLLDPQSGVTPELVIASLERRSRDRDMAARPRDEEDIAAIAKQISDHAEAIYRTWKSRGLAPADILTCPADETPELIARAPDMDKNNLEKLVSSFVSEDKARIAAQQRSKSPAKQIPSSIQFALQKFEDKTTQQQPQASKSQQVRRSPSPILSPVKPVPGIKPQIAPKTFILNQDPPDIVPVSQKPETPKRPAGLGIQSPQSPIQTWPLKHKIEKSEVQKSKTKNAMTAAYLEEVAREEERLINALKTGVILNDDLEQLSFKANPTPAKTPLKERLSPSKDTIKSSVKPDLIPKDDKTTVSSLSLVDYAKIKYQDKIEHPPTQQRLDVNKQLDLERKAPHLDPALGIQVTETRSKFEDPPSYASSPRWGLNKSGPRRSSADQVPHPELTTQQKQHIKAQADKTMNSPIRPFLTRGSVAERVLIFEKCPSELMLEKRKAPAITSWRTGHDVITKAQSYPGSKFPSLPVPKPASAPAHTTLQRSVRAHSQRSTIPRFHFPRGRPPPQSQLDQALLKIQSAFATFPNSQVPRDSFHHIVKACDCPLYWKMPLFLATQQSLHNPVDGHKFIDFWKQMTTSCHDQASRFVHLLTRGSSTMLAPEDFVPLVQDVVDTHPGLSFLKEATEFHSRYVHTVIARIFYCVNRSWSGKISVPELRRSNLLQVIQLLEEEEDINQVTAFFSYEHFYVIYCKFWELDRDHDLFIDKQDLARHNDHALSSRMIERVLSGCVTRGNQNRLAPDGEPRMSYTEFVWFLLAEEDKTHPTAIEYWFRCMDMDGDGFISMYELEYFYEEQMHRMEAIGIETLPFQDCLCQMLDMVHPATDGKITLSDLRRCKMTPIFFDTFFNLEKYLDHEQRDPFASQRDHENEMSEWDRFAADEYELLVAEEGGSDAQDQISYDETDEDCLSPNLDDIVTAEVIDDSSIEDAARASFATKAESPSFVNLNSIYSSKRANGSLSPTATVNGYPDKPVSLHMINEGNGSFLYKKSPTQETGMRVFARILNDGPVKETVLKPHTNGYQERKISDNYERAIAEKCSPQKESKYGKGSLFGKFSTAAKVRRNDDDEDYAQDSDECSI